MNLYDKTKSRCDVTVLSTDVLFLLINSYIFNIEYICHVICLIIFGCWEKSSTDPLHYLILHTLKSFNFHRAWMTII